jgi:hypothetical protein
MEGTRQIKGQTLQARPIETTVNVVSWASDPRLGRTGHNPNRP